MKEYKIDESLARQAKLNRSFNDYIDGSATQDFENYVKRFNSVIDKLKQHYKENYERNKEKVDYLQNKYAIKLAEAINQINRIDAIMPSVMIAGGSNYPVEKARKVDDKRINFWKESGDLFSDDNWLFDKIESILTNKTIYSNDEFAIERLQEKLQELEELQSKMKEINAYFKAHETLVGYGEYTDLTAKKMDKFINEAYEKKPYQQFELTNNSNKIKNTKERIAKLQKLKENKTNFENISGLEVVENKELMRIQLFFEEKPTQETIELLKSKGFKWAPSQKAWQRQLTENALSATRTILGRLK